MLLFCPVFLSSMVESKSDPYNGRDNEINNGNGKEETGSLYMMQRISRSSLQLRQLLICTGSLAVINSFSVNSYVPC